MTSSKLNRTEIIVRHPLKEPPFDDGRYRTKFPVYCVSERNALCYRDAIGRLP